MSDEGRQQKNSEDGLPPNNILMFGGFGIVLIWMGLHAPDFRISELGLVGNMVQAALFGLGIFCLIVGYLKYRQTKKAEDTDETMGGPEAS